MCVDSILLGGVMVQKDKVCLWAKEQASGNDKDVQVVQAMLDQEWITGYPCAITGTQVALAEQANVSPTAVKRALTRLRDKGVIITEQPSKRKPQIHHFNVPESLWEGDEENWKLGEKNETCVPPPVKPIAPFLTEEVAPFPKQRGFWAWCRRVFCGDTAM